MILATSTCSSTLSDRMPSNTSSAFRGFNRSSTATERSEFPRWRSGRSFASRQTGAAIPDPVRRRRPFASATTFLVNLIARSVEAGPRHWDIFRRLCADNQVSGSDVTEPGTRRLPSSMAASGSRSTATSPASPASNGRRQRRPPDSSRPQSRSGPTAAGRRVCPCRASIQPGYSSGSALTASSVAISSAESDSVTSPRCCRRAGRRAWRR